MPNRLPHPLPTRLSAIAGIIRKDLELLWPLALVIFVLQLGLTLFAHEVTEFPGARLPTDREFLNWDSPLFWVGAGVPPILSAIFIVLAVQADAASDRRHDWLTRPVGALEIAIAKITLVLGVVFLPFAAGTIIFTLVMQADPSLTLLPVAIMLRNCLFGIMLAWLASSLLQATIAAVGLITAAAFVTAFVTAIAAAFHLAFQHHTGAPVGEASVSETALTAWPRILIQLSAEIVLLWPVLWLLLVRRRIGAARIVFAAVYFLGSAIPYSALRKPAPDTAVSTPLIHPAPAEETRHA
jgi:hypothetical protein